MREPTNIISQLSSDVSRKGNLLGSKINQFNQKDNQFKETLSSQKSKTEYSHQSQNVQQSEGQANGKVAKERGKDATTETNNRTKTDDEHQSRQENEQSLNENPNSAQIHKSDESRENRETSISLSLKMADEIHDASDLDMNQGGSVTDNEGDLIGNQAIFNSQDQVGINKETILGNVDMRHQSLNGQAKIERPSMSKLELAMEQSAKNEDGSELSQGQEKTAEQYLNKKLLNEQSASKIKQFSIGENDNILQTQKILLANQAENLKGNSSLSNSLMTKTSNNLSVNQPFHTQQWSNVFNQRVVWMARNGLAGAQIRLDPPELGPVEIQLAMKKDSASIQFTSHVPAVREAIEAAIPKLRDMFEGQGLNLADANVSDHAEKNSSRNESISDDFSYHTDENQVEVIIPGREGLGLVDFYA